MIHQVVYNLFENAVKFTNPGGYIEIHTQDGPDRVTMTVRNSGHGIEPDEIRMIFDRFYKTDKSRSQDKNGMGLGLYIVKTIIHLHGGEITVSSIVDQYTQFSFWLPKLPEPEPAPREASSGKKAKSGGVKREHSSKKNRKKSPASSSKASSPSSSERNDTQ